LDQGRPRGTEAPAGMVGRLGHTFLDWPWLRRLLARARVTRRRGIQIALLGVDGCGKSTTILKTRELLLASGLACTEVYMGPWGHGRSRVLRMALKLGLTPGAPPGPRTAGRSIAHGVKGSLYYPANYEPGKKYPMVVYLYEKLSDGLHQFTPPSERSYYNGTALTQQGYFYFQPDIVFTPREPGVSVVACVSAAVKKVVDTGMVDGAKVGVRSPMRAGSPMPHRRTRGIRARPSRKRLAPVWGTSAISSQPSLG